MLVFPLRIEETMITEPRASRFGVRRTLGVTMETATKELLLEIGLEWEELPEDEENLTLKGLTRQQCFALAGSTIDEIKEWYYWAAMNDVRRVVKATHKQIKARQKAEALPHRRHVSSTLRRLLFKSPR